jgi:hypothetical protein
VASLKDTIEGAGRRSGLHVRPDRKTAFGVKNGYLVQLLYRRHPNHEWTEWVSEIIRHGDRRQAGLVRVAIHDSPGLAAAGIEARNVDVGDGIVIHKHARPFFRSLSDEAVACTTDALLRVVMGACPAMPETCRLCGGGGAAEPILLDEIVDRVCPSCLERLRHDATQARERYVKLSLNLPLAVLTGAVLAVVGAILWAGLAVLRDRPTGYGAFFAGMLIGWGASRAVGKRGPATQTLVVIFTLLSVLLGNVLFDAYRAHTYAKTHDLQIDWVAFA